MTAKRMKADSQHHILAGPAKKQGACSTQCGITLTEKEYLAGCKRKKICVICWRTTASMIRTGRVASRDDLLEVLGPQAKRAMLRPKNFQKLPVEERWSIDKGLGILDWDGDPSS